MYSEDGPAGESSAGVRRGTDTDAVTGRRPCGFLARRRLLRAALVLWLAQVACASTRSAASEPAHLPSAAAAMGAGIPRKVNEASDESRSRVDPRDFGAKCDGTSDDAPAFRRADDASHAQGRGLAIRCKLRLLTSVGTVSSSLLFEAQGALDVRAGGSATLVGPIDVLSPQAFFSSGGSLEVLAGGSEALPRWWGARADGHWDGRRWVGTDDTEALNAALASATHVRLSPGTYLHSKPLVISTAGTRVRGHGARLVQLGTNVPGIVVEKADSVTLERVWLVNARGALDWNPKGRCVAAPGTGGALGVFVHNSDHFTLEDSRIINWGCEALTLHHSSRSRILNSEFIGIGADPDGSGTARGLAPGDNFNVGIRFYGNGDGLSAGLVSGNRFSGLAQGVVIDHDWSDLVFAHNICTDIIGQHCLYAGSIRNSTIHGNIVQRAGHNALKFQAATYSLTNGGNIAVTGNTIERCGQVGIIFLQASGDKRFTNVVVSGNVITSCGEGIRIEATDDYSVTANAILDAARGYGIFTGVNSGNGTVALNRIDRSYWTGMYLGVRFGATLRCLDNTLVDPAMAADVTEPYKGSAIHVAGQGGVEVRGNRASTHLAERHWDLSGASEVSVYTSDNAFPPGWTTDIRSSWATRPACTEATRGVMFFTRSSSGREDVLEMCAKDASGELVWRVVLR
jgi:hypothetical protein